MSVVANSAGPLTLEDVLRQVNESVSDFHERPARSANDRGAYLDYPLHKVAIWGDVAAATVLLDNGADVNSIGEDGDTPLHRAFASGKTEMVRLLLSRGANKEITNRFGTPAFEDSDHK
jgi:ankyrin repeat protein